MVGEDERESGVRMILNLGHTLGHALESVTRYRKFLHGETVGLGMIAALEIGRRRGDGDEAQGGSHHPNHRSIRPLSARFLSPAQLIAASARDKKNISPAFIDLCCRSALAMRRW